MLNGDREMKIHEKVDFSEMLREYNSHHYNEQKYDFKFVLGQEHAKRALEIAAA
jgi:predicted ATPase with chaperone activity